MTGWLNALRRRRETSDRCMASGCDRLGLWLPRDGGPGAVCTRHYREET